MNTNELDGIVAEKFNAEFEMGDLATITVELIEDVFVTKVHSFDPTVDIVKYELESLKQVVEFLAAYETGGEEKVARKRV